MYIYDRVIKAHNLSRARRKERSYEADSRPLPHFNPVSIEQEEAYDTCHDNDITFLTGPAGGGKTWVAVAYAIDRLLNKEIDKILLTRPAIEACGESMGYGPGTFQQKLAPYTHPMRDVINEYGKNYLDQINASLEIVPLAFMRGRAEPVSAMIPTPDGPKRMGDLNVGDYVYGSDGRPTMVTGVFPQGVVPVVDMVFSDKSVVRCSKDHLWNTRTLSQRNRSKPYTAKTAGEIQKTIRNRHGHKNHEIPVVSAPIEMKHRDVPLDPYLLGCLLGDGSISTNTIGFTTADRELVGAISERLEGGVRIRESSGSKTGYDYSISQPKSAHNQQNRLRLHLRTLGLFGKTASQKSVPELYLNNSTDVRLGVLRGLMDTDGSVFSHKSEKSRVQFYSTSPQLAEDVKFLCESLGGIARIRTKRTPKNGTHKSGFGHKHDIQVVDIVMPKEVNPFCLERKRTKFNPSRVLRFVSDVVDVGYEECQCISVAAEDHLYLTGNFIVTHNTLRRAIAIVDEAQNASEKMLQMMLTRIGEGSQIILCGDPIQRDIRESVLECLADDLTREVDGVGWVRFTQANGAARHPIIPKLNNVFLKRLEAR